MHTLQKVSINASVNPRPNPKIKLVRTPLFTNPGDDVTLKPNPPAELAHLAHKIGKFHNQQGDYAHVRYEGVGMVAIKKTLLIVM
jgi:hypothetical protein